MKKLLKFIVCFTVLLSFSLLAAEEGKEEVKAEIKDEGSAVAKEQETIDFNKIKQVLKNDQLETQVIKKETETKKIVEEKKKVDVSRFNVPPREEMWTFLSEYWLVKNAPVLKWDFQKPDYGLNESFAAFLEKMGHFEKKFKILMVDTPNVYHFALPSNPGETIFLLSLPFVRTMDLSKQEICLLLFEDYLRLRLGYFEKMVSSKSLQELIGGNFNEKKLDKKVFEEVFKKYDEIILDTGFNFEQQFEVTRQMNEVLKTDLSVWNSYVQLLKKIDDLLKGNVLYSKYSKIYPSPELQLGWLLPKENKL